MRRAPEGETESTTEVPVRWDYLALGDPLAAGVGARRGYVDRHAEYPRSDTGARIEVVNLGRSGQTRPPLLHALRNDPSTRRACGGAQVVTSDIGINDPGHASRSYENGTCGGAHNEACLRAAVGEVEGNWRAVIGEILGPRSTREAIVRTTGVYAWR
jgi:lysophospholipase L1-like esterase